MSSGILAAIAILLLVGCASAADVSLQSLTILKSYTLLLPPSDFFVCGAVGTLSEQTVSTFSNQTDLSAYNSLKVPFTFTGKESWQPVAQISAGQCLTCGLYQSLLLRGDKAVGQFTVCDGNFSAGTFTYNAPGALNITLSCPQCNGGSGGPPSNGSPQSTPPSPFGSVPTSNNTNTQLEAEFADPNGWIEYQGDLASGQMYSIMWIGIGLLIGGVLIAALSVFFFYWLRPKRVTSETQTQGEKFDLEAANMEPKKVSAESSEGNSSSL